MASLPNGRYKIEHRDGRVLTSMGEQDNSMMVLIPEGSGFPGQQEWDVINNDDGTILIKAPGKNLYLSNQGDDNEVKFHQPLTLEETKSKWRLSPVEEGNRYTIEHLEYIDGNTAVIDTGLLRIFPPHVNLMIKHGDDYGQSWTFRPV
ncbi:hypothetical protein BGZ51_008444 [Haplosporangium sp. Z 767]|nr:hypothetical protein BGZ51_008444 [Haplosporangium sp. Z 767]KAF9179508.1 hypothetical protein BGZ50_006879 [Haplosporangium sp. Z 11]